MIGDVLIMLRLLLLICEFLTRANIELARHACADSNASRGRTAVATATFRSSYLIAYHKKQRS